MSTIFEIHNHKRCDTDGYTLLEVLLALGLTVVIFAAIAAGMRLHLVSIASQQKKIEQKQIARNLLNTIGRDIRSAVLYRAADYSGLENINATNQKAFQQALVAGQAAANATAVNPPAAPAPNANSAAVEGDNNGDGIVDIIQEEDVSFRPVLKGSDRSIMFDVSRLPRLDQYRSFGANGSESIQSTPSDIKSIGYFFSESVAANEPIDQSNSSIAPGGLFRREVDRAVASYAGLDNLTTSPDAVSRLLAPEVAALNFRYFDGADWWSTWDFDERGGLPTAVEIQLTLDPTRADPTLANDPTQSQSTFYRSVVHLPLALPDEEEDE
jgi:type II secretory pathway pseudopilin PulG